jgi:N-acetylglutamate synthase-like GNAT family acetyltransferase
MEFRLRGARLDDAAALADLVTQLGYPSQPEQVVARLTALLPADQGLLVAEVNGAVVGMVHVNRWANLVVDDTAEIAALIVGNEWRSQGIGHALLEAAEDWAKQRGCSTLQVRTNIVRQRAHEFYFQNGFRQVKTSLTLVKQL